MSKELTEQWKNKELQGGWYFLEFENGSIFPVYYCGFNREFEFGWDWKISEVLDHCNYKELQRLKEMLGICKEILETQYWESVRLDDVKEINRKNLISKIDGELKK